MSKGRIIARRTLAAAIEGERFDVAVDIFEPQPDAEGANWLCEYEVGWPATPLRNTAYGVDSVQALHLALQMIGAEPYAGRPAALKDLVWLEPGQGFGFPLPPSLRDLAIGEDKRL